MNDFLPELQAWVCAYFAEKNLDSPQLEPILGDAGFRRYFRLRPLRSSSVLDFGYLAVYAPAAYENNPAFIQVSKLMQKGGVVVPRVHAVDLERGFLLVDDLGKASLLDRLDLDSADKLYQQGLCTLLAIQRCSAGIASLPMYSPAQLIAEMALFRQWFVPQLLGYTLTDEESLMLGGVFDLLVVSAMEQPQVLVHRDFHSRNLMVRDNSPSLGVIDFQDAVVGAVTYDLVSLLRDCYIAWSQAQVEQWALRYKTILLYSGLLRTDCDDNTFLRWFDWMGLQRHIKVLGIFARLSIRDKKHRYLDDLPLVIAYVRWVLQRYAEFAQFSQWFEAVLVPLAQKQPWYRAVEIHE